MIIPVGRMEKKKTIRKGTKFYNYVLGILHSVDWLANSNDLPETARNMLIDICNGATWHDLNIICKEQDIDLYFDFE